MTRSSATGRRPDRAAVRRAGAVVAAAVREQRERLPALTSVLFWLDRRDWPELDVAGERIEGETAWRAWTRRTARAELLELRDRLADMEPASEGDDRA